jgi:UDP-3-O-[3-hydroxymyristoyl] glucosamine N-acyltransferase
LAGSTIIGDNVQAGGGSGFAGHLKVAAGSIIGGGAGVPSSIEKPDYYAGYMPAMPHREFYNILSVIKRLPEMRRQLKHLAEKVDSLKKE